MLVDKSIKTRIFNILEIIIHLVVFSSLIISFFFAFTNIKELLFFNITSVYIYLSLTIMLVVIFKIYSLKSQYSFTNVSFKYNLIWSLLNRMEDIKDPLPIKSDKISIILAYLCLGSVLLITDGLFIEYFFKRNYENYSWIFRTKLCVIFFFTFFLSEYYFKKSYCKFFPTYYLKELDERGERCRLNLFTSYLDYENKKIEDDKPSLKIDQFFEVKTREFPRNSIDENEVLILNSKTSKKTALVTIIEDKNLADILRKGESELKAQLVSIHEHTKLEIALWLENKA